VRKARTWGGGQDRFAWSFLDRVIMSRFVGLGEEDYSRIFLKHELRTGTHGGNLKKLITT